jgi:hypothetical protein
MSRLPSVLAALAATLLLAAPAQAHHRHHDPAADAPAPEVLPPAEGDPGLPQAPVLPEIPAQPDPSDVDPSWPDRPWLPPAPSVPALPVTGMKVVPGKVARMRADGKAAIPRDAPVRVRLLIRAANLIVGKPYKWGGGHGRIVDSGYDCSGAVSYALIRSGQLGSPLVSGELARTYAQGSGRWLTIYANGGHVYLEVAGLRLDTSSVGDPAGRDGVRWRPVIGGRVGFHRRHPVGL